MECFVIPQVPQLAKPRPGSDYPSLNVLELPTVGLHDGAQVFEMSDVVHYLVSLLCFR